MKDLLSVNYNLYIDFFIRLVVAGILAGFIGFEREARSNEAGLRTHFLVGIGAALIMIVSQYGFFPVLEANVRVDPSRIAAQVVSGIGFLGAGIIFKEKGAVKGLSSAAGIWAVAGIGLSIGSGLYLLGIFATFLVLAAFEILDKISGKYSHKGLEIHLITRKRIFNELDAFLKKEKSIMTSYKVDSKIDETTGEKLYSVIFRIKIRESVDIQDLLKRLKHLENVITVNFEIF